MLTGFAAAQGQAPIADSSLTFAERDGMVAVEAEHFVKQSKTDTRAFYLTHADLTPAVAPDGDPNHTAGASGGAYLEILPDTRRTHADKLIRGTNFSPEPGKMAVLDYRVHIQTPGRYYVWVRAHSTGPEDNGLHVGIDGTWPESGQRLQWCQGKNTWRWDSNQRTNETHCGEPHKIFLDIKEPGDHVIHFSMREDGFEFDKWFMTTDREFVRPDDAGPESRVQSGTSPKSFRLVAAVPPTADTAPVADEAPNAQKPATAADQRQLTMTAKMFAEAKKSGYYLDNQKWMAINPEKDKQGKAERTFPFPTGVYDVTLLAVGENDGQSTYQVSADGEKIGDHTCPLSKQTYEEGKTFHKTWNKVALTEGAIVVVESQIQSSDGKEYSRARWAGVAFRPADKATREAAAPHFKEQAKLVAESAKSSPTRSVSDAPLQTPRQANGDGSVKIEGATKTWHRTMLTIQGPYAHEQDNVPNPFTDYRMTVEFSHPDGVRYQIPGYFDADGNAANTSADSGTVWRANFAADRPGTWTYKVSFQQGKLAALDDDAKSSAVKPYDGLTGSFDVQASDKTGSDLRAQGRLNYVGKRYLQFAGTGKYFLKVGADAPETLLAYTDFDNTIAGNPKRAPLKTWSAHEKDWQSGDPTWGDGKGKGLIGAINYLSGKGCNAFSFLTYNAAGDGDNVWPFIHRDDKLHYDCSKLGQWSVVFDHGTQRGMYLHFKMQETENDDHNKGRGDGNVPASLDGGDLGVQRKLYIRELIARFGHNLALNWNLGEENTQTYEQHQAMINYIAETDAYDHPIVIHTYPGQQDQVYGPLLGDKSQLTGVSLQNSSLETTHAETVYWVKKSTEAGKPWVVAFDESGSAAHAQCPDLGYNGFDGHDRNGKMAYTQHKVRKQTLWGTLMGGGAGCEYYFGYQFDQNDIVCEDWRSRDQSWDYCRIAIEFFHDNEVPFWEMTNADALIGNPKHEPGNFCLAKASDTYVVYLPELGSASLDLSDADGTYTVQWHNPRTGGSLANGSVSQVSGGGSVELGNPPGSPDPLSEANDWVVLLRRADKS
nr:DUF5060 domain-containing protein [Rubripirellula lacrimiformis]